MAPPPRRGVPRDSGPAFPGLPELGVEIPTGTGSVRLVAESDGSVTVEVNGVPSSHLHPDPTHLVFEYMRWMMIAMEEWMRGREGTALQVAHLGGGGCSLPRAMAATAPRARQVVCELDAELAARVRDWFSLPRAPQLRIRAVDAAVALATWRSDRFDLLIRDVFAGAETPQALIGVQAADAAARVLRHDGMLLVNCAGPQGSTRIADEAATLHTAFAHLGVIIEPAVLRGKRRGNTVLLASQAPIPDGIERRLRSDPVSVRLLPSAEVEMLVRSGVVLQDPLVTT